MGYYDGLAGISPKASAYDVARITNTPAVLIVNAKGMSLSAAAFIKGFVEYQEDSQIRGVILNQVSSMMYPRLKQIIEEELPIKVYGYVPVVKDCMLEEPAPGTGHAGGNCRSSAKTNGTGRDPGKICGY